MKRLQFLASAADGPVGAIGNGSAGAAGETHALLEHRVAAFGARHGLSPREREILFGVVSGAHPKSVAGTVGCGYATVRTHLQRIYRKLGCSGARELVVRFYSDASPE